MTEYTHSAVAPVSESDVVMSWTSCLARKSPTKLAFTLGLIAFAAATGYYALGPTASVAVTAVMLCSLAGFMFPVRHEITTEGATASMLLKSAHIRWEDVRRCYVDDCGVKLSPLDRRSRLEAFRGVYLRFDGNDHEVLDAVRLARVGQCSE